MSHYPVLPDSIGIKRGVPPPRIYKPDQRSKRPSIECRGMGY